jgi:23S rRNA (guanosine2251-2'-O)-methyltransferase
LGFPGNTKTGIRRDMDTFGFTKKKFFSLSKKNRHKHITRFLSAFYQKLSTNRIKTAAFEDFVSRYEIILKWMDIRLPGRPDPGPREQIEYVSNAIHRHRQEWGIPLRDDNLLEPISVSDRAEPAVKSTNFQYQVALDGLRSLFNVGSIFRTCDAAGVRSIILGNTLGKEDHRVQKTAMGAQEWIDQEKTDDLAQTLVEKKSQGFRIIGVETIPGSIPCQEYSWPPKAVLVFGNEEYGISSHVIRVLDDIIHIPMFGKKNSLNVANAAAAVLFTAVLSPGS